MASIKASCPVCGDCQLKPAQVTVVWFPRRTVLGYYKFTCPTCTDTVVKSTEIPILIAMRQVDCNVELVHLPAEAMEERPQAGPLTEDTILDFMLDIESEDNLSALA